MVKRTISFLLPALALGLTVALPRQIAHTESSRGEVGARGYLCAALLIALSSVGAAALLLCLNSSVSARVFFGDDKYAYLVDAIVAMLAAITCHTVVCAYFRATHLQFANWFQLFGLGILPPAVLFVGEPSMRAYFIRLAAATIFAAGIVIAFARPYCSVRQLGHCCKSLILFGYRRTPGELVLSGMFAMPALLVTHRHGILLGGFVAFGMSLVLMIGAALVPLGVVLLPMASRMIAAGRITDLERHVTRLLWFCMGVTSVVVLVLEAGLGPLVRTFLGQDAPDAVAASRVLVLASVPYGVFVCLRCALDACHDTAFNTQHVVASAAVFLALVGGILAIDPFAYLGPLWSFVIAAWILGTLTLFRLRRVFAATARAAGAMQASAASHLG